LDLYTSSTVSLFFTWTRLALVMYYPIITSYVIVISSVCFGLWVCHARYI